MKLECYLYSAHVCGEIMINMSGLTDFALAGSFVCPLGSVVVPVLTGSDAPSSGMLFKPRVLASQCRMISS